MAWVLVTQTTPLLPELTQVADPGVSLEAHQGGAVDGGHHGDLRQGEIVRQTPRSDQRFFYF